MGEITSAVDDDELVEHMREVILPFVRKVQIVEETDIPSPINCGYASPEQIVTKVASTMQAAVDGLTTKQVCNIQNFDSTYVAKQLGELG